MKRVYLTSMVSGTYKLSSNTEFIIDKDADINASRNLSDYKENESIFVDACDNESGRSLFIANKLENVTFTSRRNGKINGQGITWLNQEDFSKRPGLLLFINCKNVVIKGLTLIDSPIWAIRLHNCENVTIENVNILSKWSQNNDGIVVDCSRNVTIKNCVIDTDDNSISISATRNIPSENILIENCFMQSRWAALKIGTESVGDIKNVEFVNCKIGRNSYGSLLKIVPTDGGCVEGVLIKDVHAKNCMGPIFIANGERNRVFFKGDGRDTLSKISNVKLINVTVEKTIISDANPSSVAKGCVLVSGTKKNKIKDVLIKDCKMQFPGGMREEHISRSKFYVAELQKQYPEIYALGTVPASEVYIRHVEDIKLENNEFSLEQEDMREKIVTVDVSGFTLKN